MSSRSHLWLRIGALALLVAAGVWPRGAGGRHAGATTAADAMRGASDAAMTARATGATSGFARRAETSHARLITPARRAALAPASAGGLQLND